MFEKPSGQAFVGSMSIKGVGEGMNGPDFCEKKGCVPEALWVSRAASCYRAFVFWKNNAVGMHPKRLQSDTRSDVHSTNSINVKDHVI